MTVTPASSFHYICYIRAQPDRVWAALLDPGVQKRCWPGLFFESEWRIGAHWRMLYPDGRTANSGEILEFDQPRRLVLTWRNDAHPERSIEGYSRASLELNTVKSATKVGVSHTLDRSESKLIAAASESWPLILSNLKSVLETGEIAVE